MKKSHFSLGEKILRTVLPEVKAAAACSPYDTPGYCFEIYSDDYTVSMTCCYDARCNAVCR